MLEIEGFPGRHRYRFRFADAGVRVADLTIDLGPASMRVPTGRALAIRKRELESSADRTLRARELPDVLRADLMRMIAIAVDSAEADGTLIPAPAAKGV